MQHELDRPEPEKPQDSERHSRLLETLTLIKSGYAGVDINGTIKDRRKEQGLIAMRENPSLNTPEPKRVDDELPEGSKEWLKARRLVKPIKQTPQYHERKNVCTACQMIASGVKLREMNAGLTILLLLICFGATAQICQTPAQWTAVLFGNFMTVSWSHATNAGYYYIETQALNYNGFNIYTTSDNTITVPIDRRAYRHHGFMVLVYSACDRHNHRRCCRR